MTQSLRGIPLLMVLLLGLLGMGLSLASVASAQDLDAVDREVAVAADAGEGTAEGGEGTTLSDYTFNSIVMMLCAVLVLFMQAGFAMLEAGMNAAKNTVNILAKNVLDLSVGVLLYLLVGFGLMYPGAEYEGGYFGYGGMGVQRDVGSPDLTTGYSSSADFLFQAAFAATAATIVSGAVAGRMKFGGYLIYSAILTGLIYPISGMWKWGEGFLDAWGFQDFAGSVVVHAVGGFAGLAGALLLGPRIGRYTADGRSIPIPGHNITFAALGVLILWVGWYGFNPGSQLTYSGLDADGLSNAEATTYIALTTTLSAAAGAVAALLAAWTLFGKPDLTMALNGVLAGLVGITANCDRVGQPEAVAIGGVAGVLVVLGIVMLDRLKIDDPVGAWPVHGLCGVWGGLATGIFGELPSEEMTRAGFVGVQALSTLIICSWAFLTMLGVFGGLKMADMLRVSPEEEQMGLDLSEHGMHAYPSDAVASGGSGLHYTT